MGGIFFVFAWIFGLRRQMSISARDDMIMRPSIRLLSSPAWSCSFFFCKPRHRTVVVQPD